MKFSIKSSFIALSTFASILFVTSCEKNDPHLEHDQEEISKIEIRYIHAQDTITTVIDDHGHATPSVTELQQNLEYNFEIRLYNGDELINEEILADADDHQFFFFSTPTEAINAFEYDAQRTGLSGKIKFEGTGNVLMNTLLRHGLNKNHANAQVFNDANFRNAGGADDVNINYQINLR